MLKYLGAALGASISVFLLPLHGEDQGGTPFSPAAESGDRIRELQPGDYSYRIEYRTGTDWRKIGGEFSTVIDAAGPLPALPVDRAEVEVEVKVVLPEGVTISKFSSAVSGFENPDENQGPGFALDSGTNTVTLTTTRPLGTKRGLFVNLVWPSGTFVTQCHWMKVMRQHPGIPLSVFSGVLLLWALVTILVGASRRGRKEFSEKFPAKV